MTLKNTATLGGSIPSIRQGYYIDFSARLEGSWHEKSDNPTLSLPHILYPESVLSWDGPSSVFD